ncbi:hypothetical protein [uncultured Dialister sp.]|jgi:hypothetical protein|nr:hypothetical protein [uncultured Dialister sp.]
MKRAVKLLLHGSFIMVPEFFHRCELIAAIALSLELESLLPKDKLED